MGCNCSKNRRQPLGTTAQTEPRTAGQVQEQEAQSRTQTFVLTTNDGRTQTFGSRLEASAARVRQGGGTITVK